MPSIKKIQFEGASSKVRGCVDPGVVRCGVGGMVAPGGRLRSSPLTRAPSPQNALAYKHYDAKAVVHGKVRLSRRRMLRCCRLALLLFPRARRNCRVVSSRSPACTT